MNPEEVDPTPSSEFNPCPICLSPITQDSYLDTCFHKFCYNCILHWAKVVASKRSTKTSSITCPLCKTENLSIIHGCDGISFQRHYVDHMLGDSFVLSKAHKFRLQCYYTEPGILNDIIDVMRYWKRKHFRSDQRLQIWLRREVQALIQEDDVDIIMHHIVGVIDSFWKRNEQKHPAINPEAKREEFKALVSEAARPFLLARTDRFVYEVELFLASSFNIEAYDAVYKQRLGWNNPRDHNPLVENEGGSRENTSGIPYLHIFDEDSDESL